jgi:hypothetical protein
MSALSDSASGHITIADYVNVDAAGKVNIIGGGIQFIGYDSESGVSAPFALHIEVSAKLPIGEEPTAAMEIMLVDSDGQPVSLPGPAGPQPMRIAQNVDFQRPAVPGMARPPAGFPGKTQVAMVFPNGLPLAVGKVYEWVVQVDHELTAKTAFFVPGRPDAPVVG